MFDTRQIRPLSARDRTNVSRINFCINAEEFTKSRRTRETERGKRKKIQMFLSIRATVGDSGVTVLPRHAAAPLVAAAVAVVSSSSQLRSFKPTNRPIDGPVILYQQKNVTHELLIPEYRMSLVVKVLKPAASVLNCLKFLII
jgi:hypothetical protein